MKKLVIVLMTLIILAACNTMQEDRFLRQADMDPSLENVQPERMVELAKHICDSGNLDEYEDMVYTSGVPVGMSDRQGKKIADLAWKYYCPKKHQKLLNRS